MAKGKRGEILKMLDSTVKQLEDCGGRLKVISEMLQDHHPELGIEAEGMAVCDKSLLDWVKDFRSKV